MTTRSTLDTPRRRYVTWRDGLCAGVLLCLWASTQWVTVNLSSSLPRGLYRYVRTTVPLQRGEIVRIPAVDFGRPWWAAWFALLKPIAGVPGDIVCVTPDGLWVTQAVDTWGPGGPAARQRAYGPVYQEHKGKPLPVFWGCHQVREGEVFVASAAEKSLDGRYFGMTPVPTALRTVPVWIWR